MALLTDLNGRLVKRVEAGPANVRLLSEQALVRLFKSLNVLPRPRAVAIGLAGARTESDRERIRRAAAKVWPGTPCHATSDLETALMAGEPPRAKLKFKNRSATAARLSGTRVLILSGTGSCCFGRTQGGKSAKAGGWGHLLGDKGSGYEIGLRGLKAVVYCYDRDGVWPALGARLLRALQLNEPEELIGWVQQAGKNDVAALAVEVFAAWKQRDRIATDIIAAAASSLARDGLACARRLVAKSAPVQFLLAGGTLVKQPRFAQLVSRQVRRLWPQASVTVLKRESAWGAVEMAAAALGAETENDKVARRDLAKEEPELRKVLAASPTEQRNPRSMRLDEMPLAEAIALMLDEDARIPAAILAERKRIERAVRVITRAFKRGGRLFYVGAGTSGRLGVLDASECPPTFQTPPEMVQGIMAGGRKALWQAVEGAEDDPQAGAGAIQFRKVNRRDVVVGIAASGRTPFVWGALQEAKRRQAFTVLLTLNPNYRISRERRPALVISPNVGPEILTGSTRLKAGTATKLILNILTTLSMVRLGKVASNLMVDVKASNSKLRDRAVRILQQLSGAEEQRVREALEASGWQIKRAWARLKRKRSAAGQGIA